MVREGRRYGVARYLPGLCGSEMAASGENTVKPSCRRLVAGVLTGIKSEAKGANLTLKVPKAVVQVAARSDDSETIPG